MGTEVWIPCRVVCDSCGDVLEMRWSVDPARCRGGFGSARWAREVAREACRGAAEEGWSAGPGGCWCPDCRRRINEGGMAPVHGDVTARGLVGELVATVRARHGRGL